MINKTDLLASLSLATTATLAAVLTPASAMALTFNWSFVIGSGSSGQVGQIIRGTISGLVEGSNNGTGLTVTVDSTPTGELLGGGWTFAASNRGGDAFTVTGGAVTFADALFVRAQGRDPLFFGGFGGFLPLLFDSNDGNPSWGNNTGGQTIFTPLAAASVPEPASTLGLVGLSLLGFAAKLKKKSA